MTYSSRFVSPAADRWLNELPLGSTRSLPGGCRQSRIRRQSISRLQATFPQNYRITIQHSKQVDTEMTGPFGWLVAQDSRGSSAIGSWRSVHASPACRWRQVSDLEQAGCRCEALYPRTPQSTDRRGGERPWRPIPGRPSRIGAPSNRSIGR